MMRPVIVRPMPRLVWFMHVHKAGGTSVVGLARRNSETFWPDHRNGNPCSPDGKIHRPWELSAAGLDAYIDEALLSGVSFVASEWGCPDPAILAARSDVLSIVVLRDPLNRIISDFRYEYLNGRAARSVLDWVDHHSHQHTQPNYYTRLLLGREWESDRDPDDLVKSAMERLRCFDVVAVLEDPNWLGQIAA